MMAKIQSVGIILWLSLIALPQVNVFAGDFKGILLVRTDPLTGKRFSARLYSADLQKNRLFLYELNPLHLNDHFLPSDDMKSVLPEEADLKKFDTYWKQLQQSLQRKGEPEEPEFLDGTVLVREALEGNILHLGIIMKPAPGIFLSFDQGTSKSEFKPDELIALDSAFWKSYLPGRYFCFFQTRVDGKTYVNASKSGASYGPNPQFFNAGHYRVELKDAVESACDDCMERMPFLKNHDFDPKKARCTRVRCVEKKYLADDFAPPQNLIPKKCGNGDE